MYYQIAEQINEIYNETFIENYTGSFQIYLGTPKKRPKGLASKGPGTKVLLRKVRQRKVRNTKGTEY